MSRVTLQASNGGIKRARESLKRLRLTQKELASDTPDRPPIAAWSTINGFFNGKAIDHLIFKEICHQLNLDWQDICEPAELNFEPEPKPKPIQVNDPILTAIQQQSIAFREALIPRILQPIVRSVVKSRYLPAIDRGLTQGIPRLIPLIAPAGYGKSTILGHLYDELVQDGSGWTALLLCNSLSLESSISPQKLAIAMASSLCGIEQSIVDITAQLTSTCGRGTLLIDTLDLVINRLFMSAFSMVMRQLLDQGVTVVFTCRDYEYNDFCEPTREKLPGLTKSIDRYTIPGFTGTEIRLAAETFFKTLDPEHPERGKAFADQILRLSADSRSLQDIIQNPLLLALLCDLFAQDENVPPDLTVSKLYKRYWYEKVAYSRSEGSRSSPLAIEKDNLSLAIAKTLFQMSTHKLCESIYRDDIDIEFSDRVSAAFNDLLSEQVLEPLPTGKIHFFHQTLLEYAIAYWLTRHTARSQRTELLATLKAPEVTLTHTYWLPILRQHLAIIESETEFESLVDQLDTTNVGLFSTVAFAAASRDRPDALLNLLPTALEKGEAYQRRLRQALESAPRSFIEACWDMLLLLLKQSDHPTAANTAQMVGSLLERWWIPLKGRLPSLLNAIAQRDLSVNQTAYKGKDDRSLLFGWLLQDCLPIIESRPDSIILTAFNQHFQLFGHRTCTRILDIYTRFDISGEVRQDLLRQLLTTPIPNYEELEQALITYLAALLPDHIQSPNFPLGNSWTAALYAVFPKGWDVVQAKAVGHWAAQDLSILSALLQDLLVGERKQFRRPLIALNQVLRLNAGEAITRYLLNLDLEALPFEQCDRVLKFLKDSGAAFSPTDQDTLAQWFEPHTHQHLQIALLIYCQWASTSLVARQILNQLIELLPTAEQAQAADWLLRFQPIEQHPPLLTVEKTVQRQLIRLYREQVATNSIALDRLLEASLYHVKELAVAASQELDVITQGEIQAAQLIPLLESQFPGVRANGLTALYNLTKARDSSAKEAAPFPTISEMEMIGRLLHRENNQAVARWFCELAALWVRKYQYVPASVLEAIQGIPDRLSQQAHNTFDGGAARAMIAALKAIAQSEGTTLNLHTLEQATHTLLKAIHLIQVKNSESEMIDLLCAVTRLKSRFLIETVHSTCPTLSQKMWQRNIYAVLKAVRRVEGQDSGLLDEVLVSSWCSHDVTSLILEIKGA